MKLDVSSVHNTPYIGTFMLINVNCDPQKVDCILDLKLVGLVPRDLFMS